MQKVLRFGKNTEGRDFVVGDLHGNFDWMDQWMIEKDFTVGVDRLFGLGDLIDRGKNSKLSLHWLNIMAGCVRGNHEDMMIEFHKGKMPTPMVARNGGAWYIGMTKAERQPYVDAFSDLPYAIEVETDNGLIGLTHAECNNASWSEFVEDPLRVKETQYGMPACLWGRDRIKLESTHVVEGIFLIIVGHTPVKNPIRRANHFYIDTGAGYGHEPTVVQIQGN